MLAGLLPLWIALFAGIPLKHTSVESLSLPPGCKKTHAPLESHTNPHRKGTPNTSHLKLHSGPESGASLHTCRDSAFICPRTGPKTPKTPGHGRYNTGDHLDLRLASKAKLINTRPDDDPEEMDEIRRIMDGYTDYDEFETLEDERGEGREPERAYDQYLDDSNPLVSTQPWTPAADIKEAYMMEDPPKLAIDRWPANCFLRVKLYSYYKHLANLAAQRIKLGLEGSEHLRVTNPLALPMRRKRWCYLSSAFVDKRSKDLIEIQEHVRVVDVVPVDGGGREFKGVLMVPLPSLVSFDYWFEEVHKPVKSRLIHDLFRRRRWVSKHMLYHRDKHAKRALIERLTSPELEGEIPLRWRRKRKQDYYFLQLCELRKLHDSVLARRAEDEARRAYGVRVPEIWEVDDVRFVGSLEDRMHDPDYSNVDRPDASEGAAN